MPLSLPSMPQLVYRVWHSATANLMSLPTPAASCESGSAVGGCQDPAGVSGCPTDTQLVGEVGDQQAVSHISSVEADVAELFDFMIGDHMSWKPKRKVDTEVRPGCLGDSGTGVPVGVAWSSARSWSEEIQEPGTRTASGEEPKGVAIRLLQTADVAQSGVQKRHRLGANNVALRSVVPARLCPGVPGGPGISAVGQSNCGPSSRVDLARRRPPASPCTVTHPLCSHPCISFNLALNRGGEVAKPGKVLQHCAGVIASKVSDQLTVFKVGITVNPVDRWRNAGFGYCNEGYTSMQLLHCERNSRACGFLEAALIAQFRGTLGCQNEAPGGEGFSTEGDCESMCYLYAVFRGLSRTAPDQRQPVATAVKSRCRPPPQR